MTEHENPEDAFQRHFAPHLSMPALAYATHFFRCNDCGATAFSCKTNLRVVAWNLFAWGVLALHVCMYAFLAPWLYENHRGWFWAALVVFFLPGVYPLCKSLFNAIIGVMCMWAPVLTACHKCGSKNHTHTPLNGNYKKRMRDITALIEMSRVDGERNDGAK